MSKLGVLFQNTANTMTWLDAWLPAPIQEQSYLGYLFLRLVDTIEDCANWPRPNRIAVLQQLAALFQNPSVPAAQALVASFPEPVVVNDAKLSALLTELPQLISVLCAASPGVQQIICESCGTMIAGMIDFMRKAEAPWVLSLHNRTELQAYIYATAGMPIHMMTRLFILEYKIAEPQATYLLDHVAPYANGIALADYFEDLADDLAGGRRLLPPELSQAEIVQMAQQGLKAGEEYTLALQAAGIPDGVIAICAGLIFIAQHILTHVAEHGPGTRLERTQLAVIDTHLKAAIAHERPFFPLSGA